MAQDATVWTPRGEASSGISCARPAVTKTMTRSPTPVLSTAMKSKEAAAVDWQLCGVEIHQFEFSFGSKLPARLEPIRSSVPVRGQW